MKHAFRLAAVAVAATTAFPALANGILPAPVPVAPTLVTPSSADWTGGYVGGSLGYIGADARYCDDTGAPGDPLLCGDAADFLPNPTPEGAIFGVTAGYDWQNGAMVYGVVGDLMFGDLSDVAASTGGPFSYGCGNGCGLEVSSIAMLRGRVGYAMGDVLPYATLGVALTQATAFEPGGSFEDGSFTNFVIGAGVDYMVSDTMSVGFDLVHLLPTNEPVYQTSICGAPNECGATAYSATIARLTVAYRF